MSTVSGVGADSAIRALQAPGRIPLVAVRAAAALPAAGAVATTTALSIPLGCEGVTFRFTATRAHAGGKVKALPVWTFDTVTAPETALDAEDGDGTLPLIENPISITPGAAETTRSVSLEVPFGATSVQLQLYEIGSDLAQPTTVGVHATGGR